MNKKILLVDDELDLAEVTRIRLVSSGYEVTSIISAEEAVTYLKDKVPDLILLDLLLPGMRGEDFCRQIKKDEKLKKIPVVLFTASASDVAKIATDVGAEDYIMKPFEPEELLEKIIRLIG